MKSYREIAESVQEFRENDVAGTHIRDIHLDVLWSVISGNDTRMGVAESLGGVSKRYVLNMNIREFNDWMFEHRPLVEMFYDFATTADVKANPLVVESLSESLLDENEFLRNIHSLIVEGSYIDAYNRLKEASYDDLESTPDSLYYFLAVNEAFTVADQCKPTNSTLWESTLMEAERNISDHPSLASLALATRWYMNEGGEWEGCNCTTEDKDKEYEKFFQSALKKFGVSSPAELEDEKKKEFFNYVEKNWKGEKTNDGDE